MVQTRSKGSPRAGASGSGSGSVGAGSKKEGASAAPAPEELRGTQALFMENPVQLEAFRQEVIGDYAPRTPFQRRIAGEIADITWEINRYRQMRDTMIISACWNRMMNLVTPFVEFHFGSFESFQKSLGKDIDVEEAMKAALTKTGHSTRAVLAETYHGNQELRQQIDGIEKSISDLETRRRRLHDDFFKLYDPNNKLGMRKKK